MFKDVVKACKNYHEVPSVDVSNKHITNYTITGHQIAEDGVPLNVYCLNYSVDGDEFFCGLENGVVQLRRSCDGYLIQSFRYQNNFDIWSVKSTKKLHIQFLFAANTNGDISVSNVSKCIHTPFAYERGNEINSIDVNADHSYLISGGRDATVRVYDLPTTKLVSKYGGYKDRCHPSALQSHTLRIIECKFDPNDRNMFVTGGYDDIVKIWDLRVRGGFVRNCCGPRIRGESIVFYKDQLLLGSCRINKGIQLWDIASGKMVENITYCNSTSFLSGYFINCMKLLSFTNGDYFLLVGGTGRKIIDVMCLKTHTRLIKLFTNAPARNFDCSADHIAMTSLAEDIQIVHLDNSPDSIAYNSLPI